MGSCVDNSRVLALAAALADYLGVDIDQLPLAGAAPEWYSEKALAIGAYVVASGVTTVLGVQPPVFGSSRVVSLLTEGLEDVVGATFAVEPDPARAALLIRRHIEARAVVVGKGGVGKSTLAALLARLLARAGAQVVAVDADEQCNLGATLGVDPATLATAVPVAGAGRLRRGEDRSETR